MPVDKQTKFHSISLANLKLANQTSQLHGTTSQEQTNNIDTPSSHHPFDSTSGHRPQPLGVRIRSGTYVDRSATNIDETICVKSGNQQDQTGKVNEIADSDKLCRSKRENCCCHTQLVP